MAPEGSDGHFIGACTGTESGPSQRHSQKRSARHGEVSGRSSAGARRKGYSCRGVFACRDRYVPGARAYDRARGADCRFNAVASHELRELLRAVAAYAAGGLKALSDLSARRNTGAMRLLEQMK